MEETLRSLAEQHDLSLTPAGEGWELRLPRRGEYACRLAVGPDALEWYVYVAEFADGREVWADSIDYGSSPSPEEDWINEKRSDIEAFVAAWLDATDLRETATSRLWGLSKSIRVEWERAGKWSEIAYWWRNPD